MLRRLFRSPVSWLVIGVLAIGMVFGLYWFQPWKLVVDRTVHESLPSAAAPPAADPTATGGSAVPTDQLLRTGRFISQEHATSGGVRLVRLRTGAHVLAIDDLDTSNGPDLRVWLTDRPALPDAWRSFDDGEWLELGRLKGNKGDQVYAVPAAASPQDYRSVVIWCKRFGVAFGAAELRAS